MFFYFFLEYVGQRFLGERDMNGKRDVCGVLKTTLRVYDLSSKYTLQALEWPGWEPLNALECHADRLEVLDTLPTVSSSSSTDILHLRLDHAQHANGRQLAVRFNSMLCSEKQRLRVVVEVSSDVETPELPCVFSLVWPFGRFDSATAPPSEIPRFDLPRQITVALVHPPAVQNKYYVSSVYNVLELNELFSTRNVACDGWSRQISDVQYGHVRHTETPVVFRFEFDCVAETTSRVFRRNKAGRQEQIDSTLTYLPIISHRLDSQWNTSLPEAVEFDGLEVSNACHTESIDHMPNAWSYVDMQMQLACDDFEQNSRHLAVVLSSVAGSSSSSASAATNKFHRVFVREPYVRLQKKIGSKVWLCSLTPFVFDREQT